VRVLFVNRMLGMARGGGETFDLEMGRNLVRLGCRVEYLAARPLAGRLRAEPSDAAGRVHWMRTPDLTWFPWDKVRGGWRVRMLDFRLFEQRAAGWVRGREDDFDVVQVCELPWFAAGYKRGGGRLPVVMRLTAPDFYDSAGGIGAADAVIAAGATVAAVRRAGGRACTAIQNGVDVERFRPGTSAFRSERGIGEGEYVVLYVARFHAVKRHGVLLRAFGELCSDGVPARLVLAGSGPLERRVRRQAVEAGLEERVVFLGETPYSVLPEVYRAADVKVIASEYESFCFAALEAMASGLPVVTTDTEWVPRLIGRSEGGLTVPVNDSRALAQALRVLRDDPERRRAMGEWNRREVERKYTWENSARQLMGLYKRLGEHAAAWNTNSG